VTTAGGRTQAGLLGAAVAVLLLIPVANIFRDVPLSTLAAILIFVAYHLLDWRDLVAIFRFSPFEFGLAALTLLVVAFVGIQQGIAVAVALAILERVRVSARPKLHVMGRIPGTTSWQRRALEPTAELVPGVLVVIFATPIWYANALSFRVEVSAALSKAAPVHVFVLDTVGESDIDFTGSRALTRVLDRCARDGIAFGIARAGEHLHESLRRSGLAARIGEEHFFPTVDEAVRALAGEGPPP
jgi:MFS superfamily sulfate permease-like transporter